ncbi:hypothetical protein Mapa_006627 [Marchantia paleacea]|nr:hypothetical protein Mapa_006627 [Marchantia paleacea]
MMAEVLLTPSLITCSEIPRFPKAYVEVLPVADAARRSVAGYPGSLTNCSCK